MALKIVQQYEQGVLFRLGRVIGVRPAGLTFIIPFIDVLRRVSLRIVTMPIQSQGIITRDTVSVDVSAVAYYRVVDAEKSVVAIENVAAAISQIAQTTLRKVVGQHTLDETLSETDRINVSIREILDEQTAEWGVVVTLVELKDILLPDSMKRAMARQAEAERERRAKVIAAQGELQASQTLAQAARTLATEPSAIQLRYLQTVTEIAAENNSTTIFPIPIELFKPFLQAQAARPAAAAPAAPDAVDEGEAPGAALPAADLSSLMSTLRLSAARTPPQE
jgi:regulator of protease activity HflC (stomatin/prohibitin superfamily)